MMADGPVGVVPGTQKFLAAKRGPCQGDLCWRSFPQSFPLRPPDVRDLDALGKPAREVLSWGWVRLSRGPPSRRNGGWSVQPRERPGAPPSLCEPLPGGGWEEA
ncbi:unnamed protein product [Rangifer tarandus platyrhynchus]|uniref:Uncharacterized protein n=2 Tax=Rangifer tarandus platyrhynchus TaxID=3082113 RepID=A0ABN8Y3J8_RANTA|nr:unnamed protein product [Rangifer tarandus platyrhynchus]